MYEFIEKKIKKSNTKEIDENNNIINNEGK